MNRLNTHTVTLLSHFSKVTPVFLKYVLCVYESNYVDQTNAIIYLHLQRFEIQSTPEALRGLSHVVLTFNAAPLCSGNKYQDGLSLCRNCQVKERPTLNYQKKYQSKCS